VASLIIGIFALFGQQILLYLGIRLPSLEAAGGLLLGWPPVYSESGT
jgi:small neutral amino acid transporter SnatA (MarC family)